MTPDALFLTSAQMCEAVRDLEGGQRLPQRTLSDWVRLGLVTPSVRHDGIKGRSHPVLFSVADLAKTRLVIRLRRAGRWKPAQLREVLADPLVQQALHASSDLEIVVTGDGFDDKRVIVQSRRDRKAAAIQIGGRGQYVFRFPAVELIRGNAEMAARLRKQSAA